MSKAPISTKYYVIQGQNFVALKLFCIEVVLKLLYFEVEHIYVYSIWVCSDFENGGLPEVKNDVKIQITIIYGYL